MFRVISVRRAIVDETECQVNLLTLEKLVLHGVRIIGLEAILTGSLVARPLNSVGFCNEMRCKTYTALFQSFFVIRGIIRRGRHHQHKDPPRRADGQIPTINNYFEMTAEIGMLKELNAVLVYLCETNPDGDHFARYVVAYITSTI